MKKCKYHYLEKKQVNIQIEKSSMKKSYLFYGNSQKAYLSTIKDSLTNKILAYKLSKDLKINIATETIESLVNNSDVKLLTDTFMHSDQGVRYTSPIF